MSIYWNNILIKRLQKSTNITTKYRITTNIGRIYFYFQKDCKDEDSKPSLKIAFFPNKKFPINK